MTNCVENPVQEIKNSSQEAFLEVYETFHVKLFHYFRKRAGQNETAKDLTQQVFIRLWQFRHTLSLLHSLDAQLFTMANSVLVDHLRKQAVQRKYHVPLPEEGDFESRNAATDNTFEMTDYLASVSRQLPPVRKNIFLLKIAQGYSNREIAEQLSISVKTVEDHYSKAVRQVRSLVTSLPFLFFFFF